MYTAQYEKVLYARARASKNMFFEPLILFFDL